MTFENAVRRRLGLQGPYRISCDASGGRQVQIGDYTWDSDPYEFDLTAHPVKVETRKRRANSIFGHSGGFSAWERGQTNQMPVEIMEDTYEVSDDSRPSFSKTFDSIPDIWAWLDEEPS